MSELTRGRDAGKASLPGARVPADGPATDPAAALWRSYLESGDDSARERLILHYSPLVSRVASRVGIGLPSNVEIGDCTSYGMFGLIDAIEKYDPGRGVRFEPYAMSRIRGAILDELRALDWIPRSVRQKARTVERGYQALEARLHRRPTEAELAAELGVSVEDHQQTLSQISVVNVLALDELLAVAEDQPGAMSLGDTHADLDADDPVAIFESQETRALLLRAIAELTERERRVIHLY
jgi:RNA polymerase sigma factor for flagellar operon FliA